MPNPYEPATEQSDDREPDVSHKAEARRWLMLLGFLFFGSVVMVAFAHPLARLILLAWGHSSHSEQSLLRTLTEDSQLIGLCLGVITSGVFFSGYLHRR